MPGDSNNNADPEREPPNWYVFPIAAAILITIVVTYRFACSSY